MSPEAKVVLIVVVLALLYIRFVQLGSRAERIARERKAELSDSLLNRRGRQ